MLPKEGRRRVVIEGVAPAVDGGRFPVKRASGDDAKRLRSYAALLRGGGSDGVTAALDPALHSLARRFPDRKLATTTDVVFPLWVDRERARFSAWYEFFPRSTDPGRHGT